MAERVFTQTFGVVGGLLENEGKFLLIKEAGKREDSGKWSHPAGWIDVGENPVDAARREIVEESGFGLEEMQLLGIYSLVRKDSAAASSTEEIPHAIKLIFTGRITNLANPHPLDVDSSETKWFSPDEIYAMPADVLRDADIKQIVRDYLDGQRFDTSIITHTVQN